MSTNSSRMFVGYRALGFVSNHVPLCLRRNKNNGEDYITTCVGRAFHTYSADQLGIKNISDSLPEPISALTADDRHVYAAAGNDVYAFMQGKKIIHTYRGHSCCVHLLLVFGRQLISVDKSSCLKVWNIDKDDDLHSEMLFQNDVFEITTIVRPYMYDDKFLLGSKQGSMKLINWKSHDVIYDFVGWDQKIMALEDAPDVHFVAVGLHDGRILLHHLVRDETFLEFKQDWGPVTAIAFRRDKNRIMCTGSTNGNIAVWNLEEGKFQSQMEAHNGPVSGLKFLGKEPMLVTSSVDNSIKKWLFDQPDGGARLHNQRLGHSAPPTKIRFHGEDGRTILSAGQDSTLQSFSTCHDSENRSLGRASYNKKKSKKEGLKLDTCAMTPITDFCSEVSRQSDFDGILACHRHEILATTWNMLRFTMGQHKPVHERFKDRKAHSQTYAERVTVTSCGNFGLIGYNTGHVDLVNMQSGLYRGSYGKNTAHNGAITGVFVSMANEITITMGRDSCIKFWKFREKTLLHTLPLDVIPAKGELLREKDLLAVALEDFTVIVIDTDQHRYESQKIVRFFSGHENSITDLCFSSNHRWLITAAMDSTVRVFDLVSCKLLDIFLVHSPVTSLTMSPKGTYLATAHVDDLGIYLWSNRTLYSATTLTSIDESYALKVLNMPTTRCEKMASDEGVSNTETGQTYYESPEQIEELVTLSELPTSHTLSLIHLDIIKERNKPKDPPKVQKPAPFILPTVKEIGTEVKFVKPPPEETEKKEKFLPMASTNLGRLLGTEEDLENNYRVILDYLSSLGPSAIDVELRCLSPELSDFGGSSQAMMNFIKFLIRWTLSKEKFEFCVGIRGRFIQLHGEFLVKDTSAETIDLLEHLERLRASIDVWQPTSHALKFNTCLSTYIRGAAL